MRPNRIESIEIRRVVDEHPDFSFIGRYTNDYQEGAIIVHGEHAGKFVDDLDEDDRLPAVGRIYRYFIPCAGGLEPTDADFKEYAKQDFERIRTYGDAWCLVGLVAVAAVRSCNGLQHEIMSGGLWGIESDSGDDYFKEVEQEEIRELKQELKAFGFGRRSIRRAFKHVERRDC